MVIAADIRRASSGLKGWARFNSIVRNPGLQAVLIYRFGHWLLKRSMVEKILLKLPYVFLFYRVRRVWGIEINADAEIGEGLVVNHYGGIFIGSGVKIGKDVNIAHGVTIGRRSRGNRDTPAIGDNVRINPGAVIAGPITIGHHARIGANAVVEKNIPAFALVHTPPVQYVVIAPAEAGLQDCAEEPRNSGRGV